MDRQGPHHLHGHEEGPRSDAGVTAPPDLQRLEGALRTHVGAGRQRRIGARGHPGALLQAAPRARRRPNRRSGVRLALHLPLQREFHNEPHFGYVSRTWLFFQPLQRKASCS